MKRPIPKVPSAEAMREDALGCLCSVFAEDMVVGGGRFSSFRVGFGILVFDSDRFPKHAYVNNEAARSLSSMLWPVRFHHLYNLRRAHSTRARNTLVRSTSLDVKEGPADIRGKTPDEADTSFVIFGEVRANSTHFSQRRVHQNG